MRGSFPKSLPVFVLLIALLLFGCEGTPEVGELLPTGVLTSTGRLNTPRADHRATLLADGRVFITGGMTREEKALASAELYHPATGTFELTDPMSVPRTAHTATLLPDGRVLIVGGGDGKNSHSSAELYDPATGTFTPTGSLNAPRAAHTATLLPNGQVLITGGANPQQVLATAELYDPATGQFNPTGPMSARRWSHTATLLPDGTVLIAGGGDGHDVLPSADLYHPTTGRFTPVGQMTDPRYKHTATLLLDGRVLLAGGAKGKFYGETFRDDPLASAELYDPTTRNFSPTGSMSNPRFQHTAARLQDGRVLVAGPNATAELYDPDRAFFAPVAGSLILTRRFPSATLLTDGRVLVAGGLDPVYRSPEELREIEEEFGVSLPQQEPPEVQRRNALRATAKIFTPCPASSNPGPAWEEIAERRQASEAQEAPGLGAIGSIYPWGVQKEAALDFLAAFGDWADINGVKITCASEEADAFLFANVQEIHLRGSPPRGGINWVYYYAFGVYVVNPSEGAYSPGGWTNKGEVWLVDRQTGKTIWHGEWTWKTRQPASLYEDAADSLGVASHLMVELQKDWKKARQEED